MRKILIIGASSGIGYEIALQLLEKGCIVGVSGRRIERLEAITSKYPKTCFAQMIDITQEEAASNIDKLIAKMGGIDIFIHSSGIGWANIELQSELEILTAKTNVEGLVRCTTHMFNYFDARKSGHIAVISSIAGTKILGSAPAYSATKRFQRCYVEGLAQLSSIRKSNIIFTDIRPGFVTTDLISGKNYPMQLTAEYAATRIIRAIEKKKRVAIIDWKYSLLVAFWKLIPQCIWEKLNIK